MGCLNQMTLLEFYDGEGPACWANIFGKVENKKFVVLTNYAFNLRVGQQIGFPANCLEGEKFSRGQLKQKPRSGRGAFLFGMKDQ